jgi:UDPglucose 6-dehydrogenase
MKICVIGTGYVGLVTAVCFAELGHNVVGVDIDEKKIENLRNGISPIYEEDVEEFLKKGMDSGKLSFTTDLASVLNDCDVVFNAVGTPPDEQRRVDLKYVWAVAKQVGENLNRHIVFVNKSTVPVGTASEVEKIIKANLKSNIDFDVCSNPEFLREGSAIKDFMQPDRIVVGVDSDKARQVMADVYKPLTEKGYYLMITDISSAELIKYASNAFLATKISFINEIATLCEKVGADISEVAKGIGLDSRIGNKFLNPGPGYGGSCFPKDVDGLISIALDNGVNLRILEAVTDANKSHQLIAIQKIKKHIPNLFGKTIAVWGLAFKAGTDDIRESSSIKLIEKLIQEGAKIQCYDPIALENTKKELTNGNGIKFCEDKMDALSGADALVLMTEWDEFKGVSPEEIKKHTSIVVDTRNIWNKEEFEGISYEGWGR